MKRVPLLRRGEVHAYALVDDEDYYNLVGAYRWTMKVSRSGEWYAARNARGEAVYMHRVILGLGSFTTDLRQGDHIDGNGLNNQRSNLRIATAGENRQNQKARLGSSSRFRGVSAVGGRWLARTRVDGRNHHLGYFADELEAAIAAQAWRDEHMPFAMPDPALIEALEGRAA